MDADVIVVGLGAMGSATAYWLCEAGMRVIGLEAASHPGHDRGSSHGESRIIRQAYFEDPAYVPLVREAWSHWEQLQERSGLPLLHRTGGLMIGRRTSDVVNGAIRSAVTHGLPYEVLGPEELSCRFPSFVLREDEVGVWEPMAGYLRPEASVQAFVAEATSNGADLRFHSPVLGIRSGHGQVELGTNAGVLRAPRVVLAAGAWTGGLLDGRFPLQVERQVQLWFRVDNPAAFAPAAFPIFIRELPDGRQFYGFPSLDGRTVKVALHHGGLVVNPDQLPRDVSENDWVPALAMVRDLIPAILGPPVRAVVCLYTNTPDGHFIVGPHPERPEILVLAGFSGHGFKFAPAIGRLARDLVLEAGSAPSLFDPSRF